MAQRLRDFLAWKRKADLVEYAIILFFIAIACLAFAYQMEQPGGARHLDHGE